MKRYTYKGQTYTLLKVCKMKDPHSGLWLRAAVYMNRQGDSFVREWQDFESKFVERVD